MTNDEIPSIPMNDDAKKLENWINESDENMRHWMTIIGLEGKIDNKKFIRYQEMLKKQGFEQILLAMYFIHAYVYESELPDTRMPVTDSLISYCKENNIKLSNTPDIYEIHKAIEDYKNNPNYLTSIGLKDKIIKNWIETHKTEWHKILGLYGELTPDEYLSLFQLLRQYDFRELTHAMMFIHQKALDKYLPNTKQATEAFIKDFSNRHNLEYTQEIQDLINNMEKLNPNLADTFWKSPEQKKPEPPKNE